MDKSSGEALAGLRKDQRFRAPQISAQPCAHLLVDEGSRFIQPVSGAGTQEELLGLMRQGRQVFGIRHRDDFIGGAVDQEQ